MAKRKRAKMELLRKEDRSCWVGFDPGVTGAVAVLNGKGNLFLCERFPTLKSGSGGRSELDMQALSVMLFEILTPNMIAVVEQVHSMPRQGVASTYTFGKAVGMLEALIWHTGIPTRPITPQEWKKNMGLINKPKDASIKLAQRMWPKFDIGRDANKADAALMALYARRRGF